MIQLARSALFLSLATLYPALTLAQAVPTPGAIQDQLRKTPTIPSTGNTYSPAPRVVTPPPPVTAGGRKVLIKHFDITGASVIPAEELHQLIASSEGKELTLLEIYEAADQLTHYYRTKGYTLAAAFVPEQKIATGNIRIEIIEGKLGDIKLQGTKHYRPGFITWQMNELKVGEVVRDLPLEHEMLLLNDMPGLSAKAVMQPGDDFGTSDLIVDAKEKWYEAGLQMNNYGRESIGEWRIQTDAALNGLLGVGDRFDFTGLYAEGNLLHFGRMAYSMPVTPWATRANVYYSRYGYRVDTGALGGALSKLRIEGEGENYGVNFVHPVWRTLNKNLYLGAGFDRTFSNQNELISNDTNNSHLGIAQFTALFNYLAPDNSVTTVNGILSSNFQGSPLVPKKGGGLAPQENTEAAKFQVDLSHYRTLWRELALYARFTGVMSADPLSDLDQFRLGGPTSVRAYPASEVGGDEGYFLSAELQYPVVALPYLQNERVKAFLDTGTVFRTQSKIRGLRAYDDLTGVGFGYSAQAAKFLSIDVMLAQPIGAYNSSDRNDGVRFWAAFNAQF